MESVINETRLLKWLCREEQSWADLAQERARGGNYADAQHCSEVAKGYRRVITGIHEKEYDS
jgi:hypothetical protein